MSNWVVRCPVAAGGVLRRILVKAGDRVDVGGILAEVDYRGLGDAVQLVPVEAPHAGVVRETVGRPGDELTGRSVLAVVTPDDTGGDEPYVPTARKPEVAFQLFRAEMRYLRDNDWLVYCGTYAPYALPEDPERRYSHDEAVALQRKKDGLDT